MDPKLDDILKQAYKDMAAKGVPDAQRQPLIEKLASDYNASKGPATGEEKPGFLQGTIQSIAKPFLKIPATAIADAKSIATRLSGGSKEDAANAHTDTDFGYFGKVSPLDSAVAEGAKKGDINSGIVPTALQTAGTAAEIGSYFMAPLKAGAGFWNTAKAAIPFATTFGVGKGLEAAGDGKGAAEATLEGAGNAVGAAAGFGLMKGATGLIGNWGARALQEPAVQAAGSWMKGFAEKTFNALPEAFQNTAANLSDLTNATTRRTAVALKSEFDQNFSTAKDAMIDSLVPEVKNPDLALGNYQRSLAENMGSMFRKANGLYDNVKADQTTIDNFKIAGEAMDKAKALTPQELVPPKAGASPEEWTKFMEGNKAKASEPFTNWASNMANVTKQPLTLKQVMGLWQESMGSLLGATNDEKVVIRDFASGLYADARSQLEKKNPELLDQWDTAYQTWKKATDIYGSGPLNHLKSVGDIDTFVDTMVDKPMTRPEKDTFMNSLGDTKGAVQDLFVNSVLRKAKTLDPEAASKFVGKFLDNYDDMLNPQQSKMLDDMSHFMGGNFDQFVLGMRNAQGLTDQTAQDLLKGQTNQDLLKTVNDGRLDQIADRFTQMADSPELEKTLNAFSPEEKNVIGLSITKGLFDAKLPVAALNANGTYKIAPEFAETLIDTFNKVSENKALQKILTPEQLSSFKAAATYAEKTGDLSEVPAAGWHRLMNGLISVFYFARGWMPGGVRNAIDAASASGEKTLLYYKAVQDLLDEGTLKPNGRILMGDLMTKILPGVGQATDAAASQVGQ